MCARPCGDFLNFYYKYSENELPLLQAFLWDEFKVLPCGFTWTSFGWRFDEKNQYNPLISLLIVRSIEAIRKEGRDPLITTIKPQGRGGGAAEEFLFK